MYRIFTLLAFLISIHSLAQSTASEQVSSFEIEAPQMDTIKKIWIYLPENYQSSGRDYPVIYMHDAQNLFDRKASYAGEWKVDESLDSIGKPRSIIVGIEHGGNKRIEELTPYPHEKYGGGKADAYLEFITKTLKPHIDRSFRTKPGFENTGIFGSSLGGLVSFYAALQYPEIFGMVGVYSPSFWINEEIYDFAQKAELNPEIRFYFLVGTEESEEMLPDLEKMIDLLTEKGLKTENFKTRFVEGGKHNEALWSKTFAETYLWLMQNRFVK
ncbi:hypothetical protein GCM10023115_46800 [Pontixanthobacter gangjinensis]|uniref:Alpha/beta hydrolase n=1 Tax=Christiangramia aestuarii TaxID=1028746 RepID=A0A7M3SX97_9FLAO|nr:alpha/beta hydrolase-fold protein [Christiangramia aestuarii]MUP41228.1 alpha/beta hydrolase [Christiangramia aestuarii]